MALPSCFLVSMGGRRSQHPGPSSTLTSLGLSHQRRHMSWVITSGSPLCSSCCGHPSWSDVHDTHDVPLIVIESITFYMSQKYGKIKRPMNMNGSQYMNMQGHNNCDSNEWQCWNMTTVSYNVSTLWIEGIKMFQISHNVSRLWLEGVKIFETWLE